MVAAQRRNSAKDVAAANQLLSSSLVAGAPFWESHAGGLSKSRGIECERSAPWSMRALEVGCFESSGALCTGRIDTLVVRIAEDCVGIQISINIIRKRWM